MAHCVIVRASGRRLDQLRDEASRISRGSKIDWWIECDDKTRFCFESEAASKAFERMIASASERAKAKKLSIAAEFTTVLSAIARAAS